MELAVLGRQFDLHPLARFLPGLVEEQLLKLGQAPLRGADQGAHRRIALPHLGRHRLGRNAAIHQPDAPRLAVLRLDLGEKLPQGLVVLGVTGEDLVGQRQAFRRDHQSDHHLRAIRPAVAAVAMPALVAFRQCCGVDLKVSAGQIVEQHIEAGVEQVPPAPDQMGKQRVLVRRQPVVTGVRLVRFGQTKIGAQEIGHGAVAEPLAMQLPFAARGDQPIRRRNLENLLPARSLPARQQTFGPEPIQLQFAPRQTREPARSPLPRPAQRERRETNPHRRGVISGRGAAILREQRQRPRFARRFIEHLYCLAPSRGLRRIDLSQIQNPALHHPAIVETPILHDVPVDVRLAVFFAPGLPQKHDGANLGASTRPGKWGRSSLQRFSPILGCPGLTKSIACAYPTARKSPPPLANPRSRANKGRLQVRAVPETSRPEQGPIAGTMDQVRPMTF